MPDWLILTIKLATGPIVGAIIGFFTNWLAVKMLFRPYKAKHVGRLRLPFTPGIIPKRKEALGRALGKAVGEQLITPSDLQKLFANDEMKAKVGNIVADAVFGEGDGRTAVAAIDGLGGEGAAVALENKASAVISEKLIAAVKKLDLPTLISERAGDALAGIGGVGGIIGMMGGSKLMGKLAVSVGEKLELYIDEKGYDTVLPVVREEIDKILRAPISETAESAGLTRDKLAEFASSIYEKYIITKVAEFIGGFDIAATVAQKVNEMEMAELEKLFMTVMKRELGAIVNLGALLGAIVGIINSLVMFFL